MKTALQSDKIGDANQQDIVVVNKQDKKMVVVDVVVPCASNIRNKEHEMLEEYQGAGKDAGTKGISDTSGDRSRWAGIPKIGE